MRKSGFLGNAALLAAAFAGFALSASASAASSSDAELQQQIQGKLKNKEFAQVTVKSNNGIVTLNGTVDKYQAKVDAEKKVRKMSAVKEVDDEIQVAGKQVPDATLQATLNKKLAYDQFGQPTGPGRAAFNGVFGYENTYDNITAAVNDGVVTLDGAVRWEQDKKSANALVAQQDGVKDVIDKVKVLPASIYDDQIRAREYEALYGDNVLGRYGMDPAAPIRIVVDNGHVSLYGTVQSQMEKNIASIRAGQVSGVFSVQNNLQVSKS
ncbi:MAG TPA: BON domain-containing protein [Candidatus Koribacter sp.]|jgi:osmotically-inducible protein OsmY